MQPLEFMAGLAAIVVPPLFSPWRYHGVLAPGSPRRKRIVLASVPDDAGCSHPSPSELKTLVSRLKTAGDPSLL